MTVYQIGDTRLCLPDTAWSNSVIRSLAQKGKHIEVTDQDPDLLERDEAEMSRVHELLTLAGVPC